MAIKNFSNELYVQAINTSDEAYLGAVQPSDNTELAHIVLHMFKKGVHSTLEKFRLNIYQDVAREVVQYSSDTISVSNIESLTNSDWSGTVRFDFNRINLLPTYTYYITLQPVEYTRDSETFYFSTILDWPFAINTQTGTQAGSRMELWGYE